MAFIGNTNTTQGFTPAVDFFSGNASTTAFTLSRPVASVVQVQAVVNNVAQNPSDAFTVSGNTITFTSAPSSGTNNIYVYYTSPITQVIAPGQGTVGLTALTATGTPSSATFLRGDNSWQVVSVTPTAVSDQLNSSTGYFDLPAGTTAQRPGSPVVGMIRYNTTIGVYEVYTALGWAYAPLTYLQFTIDYLVVAGGAGGGGSVNDFTVGGGGGAGGFRTDTGLSFNLGDSFTVTVGAGGAGGIWNAAATNGSNSVFSTITSAGGGGGANFAGGSANAGGSGGGGSVGTTAGAAGNTPSVSPSQGNSGGNGSFAGGRSGGGGGGASAAGGSLTGTTGGAGGAGTASSYSGSSVTYAGGGGGGGNGAGGAGGAGGGGAGSAYNGNGTAGTANTGGGGGGSARNNAVGNQTGAAGGSGIVIIRYPSGIGNITSIGGGLTYTGPTTSGGYKIYVFTAGTGTVTL